MSLIKDYLRFLFTFTVTLGLTILILITVFYLMGCFIKWEWLGLPSVDDLEMSMEELRVGILIYFAFTVMVYRIFFGRYGR